MDRFAVVLLVVVPCATLLTLLGLAAIRRGPIRRRPAGDNHVLGYIYAVMGTLTGVVLAFTVVAAWERREVAQEIVEREANALGDLYRNAAAFPEPARAPLQASAREYAVIVEADEWPAMARGTRSEPASRAYASLWQAHLALMPETDREHLWLQRSIERLNDLGDERRLRLLRSRSPLPTPLWIALFSLSLTTIAFSFLFDVETRRLHLIVTGVVVASMTIMLTLLLALQNPFGRLAPVPPDAFRHIHELVERGE